MTNDQEVIGHSSLVIPAKRVYASWYFAAVRSTTSGGSPGGGLCLSQPLASSQSRTYCLSNDGGREPARYWSAGQKRELSGVSTSSMSSTVPSGNWPHSNFVSARMIPR